VPPAKKRPSMRRTSSGKRRGYAEKKELLFPGKEDHESEETLPGEGVKEDLPAWRS